MPTQHPIQTPVQAPVQAPAHPASTRSFAVLSPGATAPLARTDHLNLPFFEAHHGEMGRCLAAWVSQQAVDESNDRQACRDWVRLLGQNQWLRYCVPQAHGGALPQLDSRALVILRETLAFHSPLADFAFAMQGLGSGAITVGGSPALQAAYLPKVASGELIAAFALSEPHAGSDVSAIETIAIKAHECWTNGQNEGQNTAKGGASTSAADDWRISGTKTWISNGGIADFYTVFAKTGGEPGSPPERGSHNISAFVVDANSQGLDDSEHLHVMAPHPLATVQFTDCPVAGGQLLGEVGGGFKLAMRTLDIFRASVAGAALGMARRALAEARAYAQQRPMFKQTLADFQLTQAKLGEMAALIDAGALLTYRAAWLRDTASQQSGKAGQSAQAAYPAAAAMAKLTATENAQRVIDMALQMHGGHGVLVGNKIEALYRDIRALRIYEGASEVQQLIIGKAVLKGG